MLSAFGCVAAFLLLMLCFNGSEVGRSEECLIYVALGLVCAAFLTSLTHPRNIKVGSVDYLILALFAYLAINHYCLSPVSAETKFWNAAYIFLSYASLRIIIPAYKNIGWFAFAIIIAIGLAESVIGVLQMAGVTTSNNPGYKITGTFFNPGPMGGYLAIVTSLSLFYIIRYSVILKKLRKNKKNPQYYIYMLCCLTLLAGSFVLFNTASRAAMLAFSITAVAALSCNKYMKRRIAKFYKTRRKSAIALSLTVMVAAGVGLLSLYDLKRDSAEARLHIWNMSLRVMCDDPLIGCGLGAWGGSYASAQAKYFSDNPNSSAMDVAGVPEYGFNEYLYVGAETGIIGLLLLLSALGFSAYNLYRSKSPYLFGLMAFMIFAFFSYPLSLLPMQILVIFFIATAAGVNDKRAIKAGVTQRIFILFLCAGLFIAGICMSTPYRTKIYAVKKWKSVSSLYYSGLYERAGIYYDKLRQTLNDNPRFLFEYGRLLNKLEEYEQSNEVILQGAEMSTDPMYWNVIGNNYKSMRDYDHAEESYRYAFDILPNRIYSLYLLMTLYESTRQEEKTLEMAREVIKFDPKIESEVIDRMKKRASTILENEKIILQ